MKNPIKLVTAVIAIVFSMTIQAQTKSPKLENSLLWEVSGNGLSKPSYIYGTVHMICSDDYFLSDKAKKAFDSSNKLILEINFSDPKEVADAQLLMVGKEPLSKKLTAEKLSKLDVILKNSTGVSVKQVDSFDLMSVMSLVIMKAYGCKDMKQYETEFMSMAKKKNIEISALETVKSQMAMMGDAYTIDEMISMLGEFNGTLATKITKAYKEENVVELYTLLTDEKMGSKKTNEVVVDNRNVNWVKQMPEMMKKESVFFAVGSAHLVGEQGVLNLLKKAGFNVKSVMN
jgi:uncharacterized protein YbaP (TraB family)